MRQGDEAGRAAVRAGPDRTLVVDVGAPAVVHVSRSSNCV